MPFYLSAQQANLQFFRANDQRGLNIFETSKVDSVQFEGVKVRVGGDFAMQFQGLNQSNSANNLVDLGTDFNLPFANLNLDVQLVDGVRMYLRKYLSENSVNGIYSHELYILQNYIFPSRQSLHTLE